MSVHIGVRDARTFRLTAGALVAVAALGLAGCADPMKEPVSGYGGSAQALNTPHNAADITFAQNMIMHHRQAIQMSTLAAAHPEADPKMLHVASHIQSAQTPEIDTMTTWLRGWGADVPGPNGEMNSMTNMDHNAGGGMSVDQQGGSSMFDTMPGMQSQKDLTALTGLQGDAFTKKFLAMMIDHHEGAITQAKAVIKDGISPDAKTLAQNIIDSQGTEIADMKKMLADLG